MSAKILKLKSEVKNNYAEPMRLPLLTTDGALSSPKTPTTYTLELTSECNQKCLGCGNRTLFTHKSSYLSQPQWLVLLERIRPHAKYIRITGGECTLHPDFYAVLEYLDTFDIPFAIFTNGVWRKPESLIELFKNLRNLNALLISLHGPDSETHNTFTGKTNFKTTCRNISRATQAGLTVDTNTVFTLHNWHKVKSIVDLSSKLGARCAVFSRYYGIPLPEIHLTDIQLAKAISFAERLRANGQAIKLNSCIPECFLASSSGACGAGTTLCTVDPQGNVRPCNHAPLWLGNLLQKTISDIWMSPEAKYWRNTIPEDCISCHAFSRCRGGCQATAMQCGLPYDPLMRAPIIDPPSSPQHVFAGLRPLTQFSVRYEPGGSAILTHYSQVMMVSERGLEVALAIDGHTTLAELNYRFGEEAMSLILDLYEQGLIQLAT